MWRALSLGGLLYLIWLLLSGHYTPLLLGLGAVSCLLCVGIAYRMEMLDAEGHASYWLLRLPLYWLWLTKEIILSNIDVIRRVLSPSLPISPTLITTKPLQKTDFGKVLYANSITLTPGTTSIMFGDDGIVVHALSQEGAEAVKKNSMNQRVAKLSV